jgi:NAD(P)-dependent dehydrogenase (short-subunit alcohol dehydrogenase family)
MRMTRRSPRLEEVAATAAFLASEKAGAITGTFVNFTSGMFPGRPRPEAKTAETQTVRLRR